MKDFALARVRGSARSADTLAGRANNPRQTSEKEQVRPRLHRRSFGKHALDFVPDLQTVTARVLGSIACHVDGVEYVGSAGPREVHAQDTNAGSYGEALAIVYETEFLHPIANPLSDLYGLSETALLEDDAELVATEAANAILTAAPHRIDE